MDNTSLNAGVYTTNLSRFIFSQRHYSIQKLRPKPGAFLPPPDLQTSAFGVDGLDEEGIWWIADNVVAKQSQKEPPGARADIPSAAVLEAQLTVVPDPADHPRHVNICGWPAEKEKQLATAQDLCAAATLRLRPESE
ncbi:MAG TPA: hypothetical protein VJW94_10090 [Candidatus Acidoferrum sp.]|nr:hypothetical protein [Candidatus Acidoferrum sp.]